MQVNNYYNDMAANYKREDMMYENSASLSEHYQEETGSHCS